MPKRFKTQPAHGILAERGIAIADAARDTGLDYTHLLNSLLGRIRPNSDVRKRLPQLLNLPLDSLFDPEVLEKPFGSGRGGNHRPIKQDMAATVAAIVDSWPELSDEQISKLRTLLVPVGASK